MPVVRGPQHVREALDVDLARLEREQTVVLALDGLEDLLRDPEVDTFQPLGGPYRAGIDDLVLTLCAAVRLPDRLTVRVVLPPGMSRTVPTAQAQTALQARAADSASVSWREAMAVRSMGRRQLPIGLTIAIGSALIAYGAGYLASGADNIAGKSVLVVTAGIAITVAWVASWMVVESSAFDWRQLARQALAYDLLARATLEVHEVEGSTGDRDRMDPHRRGSAAGSGG